MEKEFTCKPKCTIKGCTEIISADNPVAVTKQCKHPICLISLKKLQASQENSSFVSFHCDGCNEIIELDVEHFVHLVKYVKACMDDTLPQSSEKVDGSIINCKDHLNDPIAFYCKLENIYFCNMCIMNHVSHADGNLTPLKESKVLDQLFEKSLPLI